MSNTPSNQQSMQEQQADLKGTDNKKSNAPEAKKNDEIQYFETTVTKLVERENEETGEKEWVEVMSDNLYPGERLKRDVDDEKAEKAAEQAKKDREEQAKKDNK